MVRFEAGDYSSDARKVMGEASRSGITKESLGQWHNLARRFEGRGDIVGEARCLSAAIEVYEVWGIRHETYSCGDDTIRRIRDRLAEIKGA